MVRWVTQTLNDEKPFKNVLWLQLHLRFEGLDVDGGVRRGALWKPFFLVSQTFVKRLWVYARERQSLTALTFH